jgi:hypothetical protein
VSLCYFLPPSHAIHTTGGFTVSSSHLESCASLPFDDQTDIIYPPYESLSNLLGDIAWDLDSKRVSCIFVSAVLAVPENSIFSFEMATDNAAVYSSVNGQPLGRYWLSNI